MWVPSTENVVSIIRLDMVIHFISQMAPVTGIYFSQWVNRFNVVSQYYITIYDSWCNIWCTGPESNRSTVLYTDTRPTMVNANQGSNMWHFFQSLTLSDGGRTIDLPHFWVYVLSLYATEAHAALKCTFHVYLMWNCIEFWMCATCV